MSSVTPQSCDLLVTGDWVLTLDGDGTIYAPGAVAIDGDRIVWVGAKEAAASVTPRTVINRPGCAILPGLVNAHTHLFQTLVRGLGDDLGLLGWIRHVVWLFVDLITDEDLYIATLAGAVSVSTTPISTNMRCSALELSTAAGSTAQRGEGPNRLHSLS
ncbi:MAG: amidohydrolase family protein [Bryobacteraceae bacterium]